jgi:pimeloyl-ACP methyl ester carboxylesterase
MRQPNDQVLLTASLFKFIVGHLTYYPNNYPALPRLIAAVRDGGIDDLGTILVTMAAEGEALNIPAYVSVECRDRPHYRDPLPDGADALDETSLHGICDDWSDLGPPPVIPGGTEIPTIVLAGQFDPNADPSLSRHVADVIGGHARWIEFSLIGHNVTHFSSCGMRIVADFVDQPARAPDTSCAGQAAPIRFLPGYPAP